MNKDKAQEADREANGYVIRDGIVVVVRSAVIPDGTILWLSLFLSWSWSCSSNPINSFLSTPCQIVNAIHSFTIQLRSWNKINFIITFFFFFKCWNLLQPPASRHPSMQNCKFTIFLQFFRSLSTLWFLQVPVFDCAFHGTINISFQRKKNKQTNKP